MVGFTTPRMAHVFRRKKAKTMFSQKKGEILVKSYTERDYDLYVYKRRKPMFQEYMKWDLESRILYATCLILGEEGGVFWTTDYTPFPHTLNELLMKNELVVGKHNERIVFICCPPMDYIYEKIHEDGVKLIDVHSCGRIKRKGESSAVWSMVTACVFMTIWMGIHVFRTVAQK